VADVRLRYEEGTIRMEGAVPETVLEAATGSRATVEFDPRTETYRVPAFAYHAVARALSGVEAAVTDNVFDCPDLELSSTYELRGYQEAALEAWREADRRGVVELPTGSGKTVVAIGAMEAVGTPTLVVVPTVDLLDQWHEELSREFDRPVGRLGGGTQRLESLTVATYDSAYLRTEELGDRFGLVVFDEVHHLGGEGYRDIARLLATPARMGLTATFERPDGAHEVVTDLLGPVVYRRSAEDMAGEHLAAYDIKRIEVELTPQERETYERAQGVFTDYLANSNLTLERPGDYQKLVKRSGTDDRAREALLAKQRAREVMMNAQGKIDRLAELLDRHREDRIILFTAHTELVYRLSERFLLPAITHETATEERGEILDRFRDGRYSRVVTANVLDEGVDVPDANVAVVLSGSGSQREFTQRLGRILRPKADGGRALLYELVTEETAEQRVARRRR
jgi:superfamily II DNA or RNA helicase